MEIHITQLYQDADIIRAEGSHKGGVQVTLAQSKNILKMSVYVEAGDKPYYPTRAVNADVVAKGITYLTGAGSSEKRYRRLSDVVVQEG